MIYTLIHNLTGLGDEGTTEFTVLFTIVLLLAAFWLLFMAVFLVANAADQRDKERKRRRKTVPRAGVPRISGHPPADQYVVPATGPQCGDKDCELMGCAIIGSCQRKRA